MVNMTVRELQEQGRILVEDGNHGEQRPRPDEFVDEGHAFIRAADMTTGVVDFRKASRISATARARIRKGIGAPGDVLLSHKGTVGKVARVPMDAPAFVCSPQTTFYRSLDPTVLDQMYLYYFLQSQMFQGQLASRQGETDMAPYVSLTAQRQLLIDLRPVAEQRAIAGTLEALDELVANLANTQRHLDALAAAVFTRAAGSNLRRVDEVAKVMMGQSPPGSTYNEVGTGLPFHQGIRDFGDRYPTTRVYCSEPSRVAGAGDLLLAVRAPIGTTNIAVDSTAFGRGLAALRSPEPSTLLQAMHVDRKLWTRFEGDGTVFASISREQIGSQRIPWPTESIEHLLATLDEMHLQCWTEERRLRATRDELLPLLMSGKVSPGEVAA